MRQASVRWGLSMGAVAAALGVISLLIGLALTSFQQPGMDPTGLVVVILVRAVVRLLFFGMAGGLAYYAGYRFERERALARAEMAAEPGPEQNRMEAVLVGGLVLLCDWVVQTAFIYVTGMSGAQPNFFAFLGSQIVLGAICVLFGAGLGGLGARDVAARDALRKVALTPAPATTPPAPPAAPAGHGQDASRPGASEGAPAE
ncbi:MAG TPA: hypothetical protein VFY89_02285 [Ktedonobacterales bacterium]